MNTITSPLGSCGGDHTESQASRLGDKTVDQKKASATGDFSVQLELCIITKLGGGRLWEWPGNHPSLRVIADRLDWR